MEPETYDSHQYSYLPEHRPNYVMPPATESLVNKINNKIGYLEREFITILVKLKKHIKNVKMYSIQVVKNIVIILNATVILYL